MSSLHPPTPTYHFTLLRHGESVGNAEKRHQGHADFPLTEKGRGQARRLGKYWLENEIHFDQAIASPLSRAKETAEIITQALELPLDFDRVWMERNNGKLAGLLHEEALEKVPPPDFTPLYQPVAGTGESQWELFLRASQALNGLMKLPSGDYLIISHGGLLNMVMHAVVGLTPSPNFLGPNFRFYNTGFTSLVYEPQNRGWSIHGHNARPHL
ncbi:MAG: Phosphoserine phosphatase 1 [Chloroflexi bacterium]|nr:Phosphoserine phosphatase 1 [Chloroflexota bacterium]